MSIARLRDARAVGLRSIRHAADHWAADGYGTFVVADDQGQVLGVAGLARPFRCVGPHLVCAVQPNHRERRVALAACAAVIGWWNSLNSVPVYAHVEPANEAGQRLAEALGGTLTRPTAEGTLESTCVDYVFLA